MTSVGRPGDAENGVSQGGSPLVKIGLLPTLS